MRIAVAYESGNVFAHFGRTGQFKIYEIENGQVTATRVVGTGGQGHGALTDVLRALGADTLICGGIGSGARMALAKPDCMVQHPLPARRGEEIATDVFEKHANEIFDEAENRLHVEKAVLAILLAGK